ncbi:hypothetical protein AB4865_11845 [Capnocytophaga sp. ARDL2]|uniref:hypothetical protein n=1 Tax=Capnocytophaga sp. ARDL2 TaxID=3238809 RepID=UPI0035563BF0
MKKILFLVAAMGFATTSSAQIVNIPDFAFKQRLLDHNPVIDTNGDGEIQVSEAEAY